MSLTYYLFAGPYSYRRIFFSLQIEEYFETNDFKTFKYNFLQSFLISTLIFRYVKMFLIEFTQESIPLPLKFSDNLKCFLEQIIFEDLICIGYLNMPLEFVKGVDNDLFHPCQQDSLLWKLEISWANT